jgi:alpha-galactosidase
MYVDDQKESGVIFSYLVNSRYGEGSKLPFKLKGLDPDKKYSISEINIYPGGRTRIDGKTTYSGEYLMTIGFNPEVNARRASVVCEISVVE